MSESDFIIEPWRHPIPTAIVPKPQIPAPLPVQSLGPSSSGLDPITQAIEDRTDSLIIERLARKKGIILTTTPKLNGLQDAFKAFTSRVEAAADSLTKRMDSAATTTETAIVKFGAAVGQVEATAKSIDDAANQLTNGGPPLEP
jgi:hypothetical protein